MSHLFSFELPWPFSYLCINMGFYWILWASLAQLHYFSSLGFMGLPSTPYFLYFHYFGSAATYSHFSTSYTAHGLLFFFFFPSFRAPLCPFTYSIPICLSHEPIIHYSCRLGLMSFLFVCQLLSVRGAGLLLPTWASKMALNKGKAMQQYKCNINKMVIIREK